MAERSRPSVLIVDDDPAIVRVYEEVLRHAGFEVRAIATTSREALEADPVDIILLDHHLPDGEGLDLLGPLRNQTDQPSIIMVTGAGDEHLAASALRRGAEDYLVKDGSLIELLPQILERVRRTRALRHALDAAEQDLMHAERRSAVGEMTVTLKHEINNPLMSAFTEAELLLNDPALDETRRHSIRSIHEALGRIRDTLRRAEDLDQVQSREYLEGIDMVDLDAGATDPAPVSRGEAAVWMTDEDLARIVTLLLKHAGFGVERVPSLERMERVGNRLGLTLVVVAGVDDDPLCGLHPPLGREWALVALGTGGPEAALQAGADHFIGVPFDPGTFAEEIVDLMDARTAE